MVNSSFVKIDAASVTIYIIPSISSFSALPTPINLKGSIRSVLLCVCVLFLNKCLEDIDIYF